MSSAGTVITLPAYNGATVVVTMPALVSGSGQVGFQITPLPPNGWPILQSGAQRIGQSKGAPRRTAAYPGIANNALFYINMQFSANVTLAGYPGFKVTTNATLNAAPYYMAYIAPLPPPPTTWNLNIEGPGGTSSPLNWNSCCGPQSYLPGNFYLFAPYSAVGPALNLLPSQVAFLQPNQQVIELLSDAAGVNITSIVSSNTAIVTTSASSGQTDVAGHMVFTLTSGNTPGNATVTVHDENGGVATVTVQNVQTNSGITIPGLPVSQQFTTGITAGGAPYGISAGPDGNVWFTENLGNRVGSITPAGTVSEFALGAGASPTGIAPGLDAAVWAVEAGTSELARVSTAAGTTGQLAEYAAGSTLGALNGGVAAGPASQGQLMWYAATNGLGVLNSDGSLAHEYSFGAGTHAGTGLVLGPDGNFWFTDRGNNSIGKMTTAGVVTYYAVPTANAGLTQIAVGADGKLWFGENTAKKIASVSTGGAFTEYDASPVGGALAVGAGPDGSMWFSSGSNLGRITPAGVLTVFATGASGLNGITAGPDGKLYFTESTTNAIGRLSL